MVESGACPKKLLNLVLKHQKNKREMKIMHIILDIYLRLNSIGSADSVEISSANK